MKKVFLFATLIVALFSADLAEDGFIVEKGRAVGGNAYCIQFFSQNDSVSNNIFRYNYCNPEAAASSRSRWELGNYAGSM